MRGEISAEPKIVFTPEAINGSIRENFDSDLNFGIVAKTFVSLISFLSRIFFISSLSEIRSFTLLPSAGRTKFITYPSSKALIYVAKSSSSTIVPKSSSLNMNIHSTSPSALLNVPSEGSPKGADHFSLNVTVFIILSRVSFSGSARISGLNFPDVF